MGFIVLMTELAIRWPHQYYNIRWLNDNVGWGR